MKKIKRLWAAAFLVACLAGLASNAAYGAGSSVTVTTATTPGSTLIDKVTIDWVSDDTITTTGVNLALPILNGLLMRIVFDPGTPAPTDNYDVTFLDPEGLDILSQSQDDGADRDTTTTEAVYPMLLNYDSTPIGIASWPPINEALTLNVDNMGTDAQGQIILYIRKQ